METNLRSKRWTIFITVIQILAMQVAYYFSLISIAVIISYISEPAFKIISVFNGNALVYETIEGRILGASHIANSIICALVMAKVVGKARRILDFAVTSTIFHLIIVSLTFSIPLTWEWWVVQILCVILQTLLGEYISARIEISEDPLVRLSQVKVV